MLIGEPASERRRSPGSGSADRDGDVPESLKTSVSSRSTSARDRRAKFRGEFEERLKAVLKEITDSEGQFVVLSTRCNAGRRGEAEGSMDAGNMLKPMLARGELRVVGATTLDEYRKHLEKDAALERRFQPCTSRAIGRAPRSQSARPQENDTRRITACGSPTPRSSRPRRCRIAYIGDRFFSPTRRSTWSTKPRPPPHRDRFAAEEIDESTAIIQLDIERQAS